MKGFAASVYESSLLLQQSSRLCFASFTGRIEIEISEHQCWHVYTILGRIAWVEGSQSSDCFERQLAAVAGRQFLSRFGRKLRRAAERPCGHYGFVLTLVQQREIPASQVCQAITSMATDLFFDAFQAESGSAGAVVLVPYAGMHPGGVRGFPHMWLPEPDTVLLPAWQAWDCWKRAGFAHLSPNAALVSAHPKALEADLARKGCGELLCCLNGQKSLRDAAFLWGGSPLELLRFLHPYRSLGWIDLRPPQKAIAACDLQEKKQPALAARSSP